MRGDNVCTFCKHVFFVLSFKHYLVSLYSVTVLFYDFQAEEHRMLAPHLSHLPPLLQTLIIVTIAKNLTNKCEYLLSPYKRVIMGVILFKSSPLCLLWGDQSRGATPMLRKKMKSDLE